MCSGCCAEIVYPGYIQTQTPTPHSPGVEEAKVKALLSSVLGEGSSLGFTCVLVW